MTLVVHLITGLGQGGAETMLAKLVAAPGSEPGSERVEHAVVSMTGDGALARRIADAGVPVHDLGMRRGVPDLRGAWRLVRLLGRLRPDVLQTWLYHADFLGLVAGRMAGVPAIAWNLRCSEMDMNQFRALSRALPWVLSRLSPLPAACVVNSRAGRLEHERLGYRPRRWVMIPNGFDIDRFRPDEDRRHRFRGELGLAADAVVVGMVARVDPMKDHTTFLDAAARVAAAVPEAVFVLVGQGCEDGGALAGAVAARGLTGRVRLLGRREDVAEILPGFDIFVLSSVGEGFPNVIGEAMAAGVPVVASDVGDCRAIVGEAGRVVPPGDATALAGALAETIAPGEATRAALGRAARARIEAEFTLPAIVALYDDFYRRLVNGHD